MAEMDPEADVEVIAEADVRLTEDEDKVERALRNLLAEPIIEKVRLANGSAVLRARASGLKALEKIRYLLRRDRIRDSARAVLMAGVTQSEIRFFLNKQAAYVNRISFSEPFGESPLGPVALTIKARDPVFVIDWLTARDYD